MPSVTFSEHELCVLEAICNTFAPALSVETTPLYRYNASALNVPQVLAEALYQVVDADRLMLFKLTLNLLDQPLVNSIIGGNARSFLDMPLDERTALLQLWSRSAVPALRFGFQAFKRLALFFFYTVIDSEGRNPLWAEIDYPGPTAPPEPSDKPIRPLELTTDTTLTTDVVIVGSGAGGGVVAGELSAAGLDVIVLDKGGYAAESDFHGRELESAIQLFENRGLLTSNDLGVIVLAGSTLGGGTTVNWCASFRTPDHVLREWEQIYGVTGFTGEDYQAALDAVSARINVNTTESVPNVQNAAIERGGNALGWKTGVIPRNVKGCEECGFCNYGCQYGAKQSTLKTYLQDVHDRGGRIIINAHVERILTEFGMARGVVAAAHTPEGQPIKLTINARAVVMSAGAIHTPAVLMRSGLTNANIGLNLHLHPTSVTYGMHEQAVRGWHGPMMTRYISEFSQLEDGYGVSMQTAPIHPGIAALVLPWSDGYQHKTMMKQLAHLANIIIITRDHDGGQIKLNRVGQPVIHYQLSKYDAAHLQRGILESLKVHQAAGAVEIGSPHTVPLNYRGDGDFDAFLKRVEQAGLRRNTFALLSAHQMSSCRMGSSPRYGAIDPTGETFEVRNLFVADASALPTALGVNPMLTIMGVAYTIAQHIKAKLT
ncbi:MAG: GMC family oxidoreductase N-terminal domain-containing protein [Anaerolineae bacterium]|nr:GMC family oxidoreductase N-terminal domain-containing protein [Anaerolineae bacterium]